MKLLLNFLKGVAIGVGVMFTVMGVHNLLADYYHPHLKGEEHYKFVGACNVVGLTMFQCGCLEAYQVENGNDLSEVQVKEALAECVPNGPGK